MISIVVTCYNLENYIERCISSILNNTYKDIEVIVVNDCSTDNSLDVIKTINDDRVIIINSEVNVGAGMSRRVGIQKCKGDYIMLIDGDDTIELDCLETLYGTILSTNSDIVRCHVRVLYPDKAEIDYATPLGEVVGSSNILEQLFTKQMFINNCLIKKDLWDKIVYSDSRFIEDTPTLFKLLAVANKATTINYVGYNYYQLSSSLCHTTTPLKTCIYTCLSWLEIARFAVDNNINYNVFYKIANCLNLLSSYKDKSPYMEEWNKILTIMRSFK